MLKKSPGLRERNRIRTRDEILVATSVLLGDRGYQSTTIDDVANQAGVSRGTIYTYFPEGREQLVHDAYQRVSDLVAAEGISQREQHDDVVERIVALAVALVSIATTPEGRFYGLMGHDIIAAFTGHRGISVTTSRHFNALLIEDLTRAVSEGSLEESAPIKAIAVLISGSLREIGVVAAQEPERAPELLRALRLTCEALLRSER